MSDDIFSQLFNLFNNDDDDVNWKLVEQISNHINKDSQESSGVSCSVSRGVGAISPTWGRAPCATATSTS